MTSSIATTSAPAETPATPRGFSLAPNHAPLDDLGDRLKPIVARALDEREISNDEALSLVYSSRNELGPLCRAAALLRDYGKGKDISFSPKVFIPLTRLCRDFCGYCTFRQSPFQTDHLYMTPDEVLEVARAGEALGCTEALFTLGERPEQRYPEARRWLSEHGYSTTIEYLKEVCAIVLRETSLLPHGNPGTMSSREMQSLKEVSASMGVMLEVLSERLCLDGNPHHQAPSKWPKVRMKTLNLAGRLKIPFTTGILIGIGETRKERIDSLLAIRESNHRYGHIQEIIVQNFRAKPNTKMALYPDATTEDLLWTIASARLILGSKANIQVPPNLNAQDYPLSLLAGINDWGGVSPLTIDYVNPEAPWPQISELRRKTEELGFKLRPRLPVYPEYILKRTDYLPTPLKERTLSLTDQEGYVKGGISRYVTTPE